MHSIPPEFLAAVNELPEAVLEPMFELLKRLTTIFSVEQKTPAGFAAAESELVAMIMALGRDLDLALVSEFAMDAPLLAACSEDESTLYRRLEPASFEVITPFGRGSIQRSVYREIGVRNGPTIDPVALGCGLIHQATPRALQLIGAFGAALPSREAHTLFKQMGIDSLSRSTLERTAQAFGKHLEEHRDEVDSALIETFMIPEQATTLSVSVDRVSLPIEKPKKRPVGRPKKGSARRPIELVYEMAYVLCWTLYDAEKTPLYTARAGRMPADGASFEVEERLRWDVLELLKQRPDLRVIALSDGAQEMINLLGRVTEGLDVAFQLVDFWHAVEYLAKACSALGREVSTELKKAKKELLERPDGADAVLRRMRRWRQQRRTENHALPKDLNDAIRYFDNKIEAGLMHYATAHSANFPVGSGTVEATAKTLVSVRMKRSGSRWKHASGQHILTLRSHMLSSRWSDVCEWCVAHNDDRMPALRVVA